MSNSAFTLVNVRKTYSSDPKGFNVDIPELKIRRGVVTAILGRSGSGKTTLLNLLGGLEQPTPPSPGTPSSLLFHSIDASDTELVGRRVGGRFARIGYVFQEGYLLRHSTLALNLASAMKGAKQPITYNKLHWACLQVGLDPRMLDKRAWMPSGGEKQRVGIARAILSDPEVILADEPASSLDPQTGLDLMKRLKAWCHAGNGQRSVIWVTHNLEHAAEVADELVVLNSGRVAEGPWPRSMPDNAGRDLEALVYGTDRPAANTEESDASPPVSDGAPHTKGDWFGFGRRAGLAELLRAPHSPVWDLRWLSRLISYPPPGNRGQSWPREFAQVVKSYRQLTFLGVMALAGIFAVCAWVGTELIDRVVESAKLDPRACQIIVDGQRTGGPGLSRESLDILKTRPWLPPTGGADARSGTSTNGASALTGCGGPVAAYERTALPRETVAAAPGDSCTIRDISVNPLVIDPEDPILAQIPVRGFVASGANSMPATLAEAFAPDRPGHRIVLSARLLEMAVQAGNCIPKQVHLSLFGQMHSFDVAGAVADLPPVGSTVPNAAIPMTAYKTLYYEVHPGESLANPGQAAVYFTEGEFPLLANFLERSDMYFDRNNLASYTKTIETSNAVYWIMGILRGAALIIVSIMLCFVFSSFIYRNHRPLSVLRAMGVGSATIMIQIGVYLGIVWLLSLFLVIPAELALSWVIHAKVLPSLGIDLLIHQSFASWVWPPLAVLSIGLLSAATVFGVWWKKTTYLAEALKEDG